jgi:hypothetical protein
MQTFSQSAKSGLAGTVAILVLAMTSLAQAQPAPTHAGELDFWPKRLSADTTALLYVQLERPEVHAIARLECGDSSYELGPATWSHSLGYIHAFDLEFSAPRTRANCQLRVNGREGREYLGSRPLVLRPKAPEVAVKSVFPDALMVGDSATFEVRGHGFGSKVAVKWIATNRFSAYEETAFPGRHGKGQRVRLTSQGPLQGLEAGDYLVLVENSDHTAGIYGDHIVVEPQEEPELVRSRLAEMDGRIFVLVEGFGLSGLTQARLQLPAGDLPLTCEPVEGQSLETLRVQLPAHSVTDLASAPELTVDHYGLTVTLSSAPRLSKGAGGPSLDRD